MTSRVIAVALSVAASAWLAWIVASALRTGVARIAGGREFKRRSNPIVYWFTVLVQALFMFMFIGVAAMRAFVR